MNEYQIIAVFTAIVITPCIALLVFQWFLDRSTDRYFQRLADKARHPSMQSRDGVRLLNLSLEDDFYGCEDCFAGIHGINNAGRCMCCSMILPTSYVEPVEAQISRLEQS